MVTSLLAFGAGLATVASPCVLPVLPILLGASSLPGGRWRPLAITAGFVATFAAVALAFGASTTWLGLSPDTLRSAGVAVLVVLGAMLLLRTRPSGGGGRWVDAVARWSVRMDRGPAGGLLVGASLGLLWTPCAGPVLASILALTATAAPGEAGPLLLAYAAGAGVPMLAIAFGSRHLIGRLRGLAPHAHGLQRGFGVAVLATAAAMHWHVDTQFAAWLSRTASTATAAPRTDAPAPRLAPEFDGLDGWLNSAPLSMASLRGRVVVVDFWTFACVNCLRTLPHLRALHDRYRDEGLTVVGVHTPEFAFERDPGNVRDAVARLGVTWPVALDTRYRTWSAWGVQAWPTLLVVDRQGRVVWQQVGEGGEAAIDAAVRRALAAT